MDFESFLLLTPITLFFASLVIFIGIGVFIYSLAYMKNFSSHQKRVFYSTLSLFTLAMLGLILTDHLLLLFIFWEMTSITSFFLIGLKNNKPEVREKAKWALYTTVGGGLFLLVGILSASQIGQEMGLSIPQSFSLRHLCRLEHFVSHELSLLTFFCFFIGICSKSALFPFSFWLPLAMAGPTPVSSFLHSATMVKAGIILGLKTYPLFGEESIWQNAFILVGSISALYAAFQCFLQKNLKTMLAYSTSCVLGILAILLGIGGINGLTSLFLFIMAHALYKASLFQLVGHLDLTYKTMDSLELREKNLTYRPAFFAVLLSAGSMVGLPLSLGFYAKESIYLTGLSSTYSLLLSVVFFLSNLAMGIQAITFLRVFWPKKHATTQKQEGPPSHHFLLVLPAVLFSSVATLAALFPNAMELNTFIAKMLLEATSQDTQVSLKIWHGLDSPYGLILSLSLLTIVGSLWGSHLVLPFLKGLSRWSSSKSDFSLWPFCQKLLGIIIKSFDRLTNAIQNDNFRHYMRVILAFISVLILTGLVDLKQINLPIIDYTLTKTLILAGVLLGLALALCCKVHYRVLIYFALSSFFLVVYFGTHSAIDVSMTQLMVESLSLFFVFFLVKASGLVDAIHGNQFINLAIASLFGISIWIFSLAYNPQFEQTASNYFLENSLLKAKGENVVNVILVDFRAMDTLGEVIVVAVAIIGVGALLKRKTFNE